MLNSLVNHHVKPSPKDTASESVGLLSNLTIQFLQKVTSNSATEAPNISFASPSEWGPFAQFS